MRKTNLKKFLLWFRYYLELIAVPAFIFLIVHLAGHGIMIFLGSSHEHNHKQAVDPSSFIQIFLNNFFTVKVLGGILLLILFIWLWHRPMLKKWVPCSHDHCHGDFSVSHVFATMALCLHFFPEAGVRYELLHGFMEGEMLSLVALIGFLAHFFVDIIVAVLLSSYWKTRKGFWLSFGSIVGVWFVAFFVADSFMSFIPHAFEGFVFLMSAFLLSMFVHKPHKPILECSKCRE